MIIIWKLNEAWPLKKKPHYGHFLTALKDFQTERELYYYLATLKVFNTEKGLHHLLRALRVFNIEKQIHHFLETLKGFNFEKWLRQTLVTRKVYQYSYCTVLCWWTAASQGRLSYHIYDKRTSPAPILRLSHKWYVRLMKLFNFKDCRVSWTPDKLHRSLHPPPN